MNNEEFQMLVLEALGGIKDEISGIKDDMVTMKDEIGGIKEEIVSLKKSVDVLMDQTTCLTEFKSKTESKLSYLEEREISIAEMVGEHEIEIRTLKKKIV